MMTLKGKKNTLWFAIFFLFVFLELFFDVIEVAVGKYLLVTNSLRPQVGRLWEEEKKDILAETEAIDVESAVPDSIYGIAIFDYDQLFELLEVQPVVYVTRGSFISFYKRLEPDIATRIFDPLDLFDLDRNSQWTRVKISRQGDQISFVCLDGFGHPLKESFFDAVERTKAARPTDSPLSNDGRFKNRIVTAERFFNAFDRLSRPHKLQVVGNPFHLIQIKDNLVRVGISRESVNGSVILAFEINRAGSVYVEEVKAGELAVSYLIAALNDQGAAQMELPAPGKVADG